MKTFRQQLLEETQRWTEENLLSPEQREAILRRYDNSPKTSETSAPAGKEYAMQVVLILGVFLIGLAVLLLMTFNWEHLPGAAKLAIIGTALAAAHAAGFFLRRFGRKNWADGVFFFAGLMYGVSIWQVGQIFHMSADQPMFFWLWAVGVFLLALALTSTPLHILSVALLVAWVTSARTGFFSEHILFAGFIPFSAWSLPLFAAAGIGSCMLLQKKFAATLYIFLLGFWWIMQGSCSGLGPHLTFHIVAAGLIYFVLASRRFPNIHNAVAEYAGILAVAGGLLAPSFLDYWRELLDCNIWNHRRISEDQYIHLFWSSAMPVIDLLVLYGLFRWRNRCNLGDLFRRNGVAVAWTAVLFVLWIGSFIISLHAVESGYYRSFIGGIILGSHVDVDKNPLAVAGMFAVNALIVWMAIGMMLGGLKRGRDSWFWLGTLYLLLWAAMRYCDLFSDFGMLGSAGIFLFCGLAMIGIVYVWTNYRHKFLIEETVNESNVNETNINERGTALPALPILLRIVSFWQSERIILSSAAAVAILQFAVLGGMIANEMVPHVSGTTIFVKTAPVDPRDLFMGDYVILNYEFSSVNSLSGHEALTNNANASLPVYVSMEPEQGSDLWKAIAVSRMKPKSGIFIRGSLDYGHRVNYGIERYYVQEGKGKEIEDAMNRWRGIRTLDEKPKSVVVELVVASNGKASVKTVHVREESQPPMPISGRG